MDDCRAHQHIDEGVGISHQRWTSNAWGHSHNGCCSYSCSQNNLAYLQSSGNQTHDCPGEDDMVVATSWCAHICNLQSTYEAMLARHDGGTRWRCSWSQGLVHDCIRHDRKCLGGQVLETRVQEHWLPHQSGTGVQLHHEETCIWDKANIDRLAPSAWGSEAYLAKEFDCSTQPSAQALPRISTWSSVASGTSACSATASPGCCCSGKLFAAASKSNSAWRGYTHTAEEA